VENIYGLKVEVRPSIGQHESPLGLATATHAQLEVWAGNRQTEMNYGHALVRVGMCDPEGKHINWESHAVKWPSDSIAYVASEVGRLLDSEFSPAVDVPQNPQPPEVEDIDDEGDEIEEVE